MVLDLVQVRHPEEDEPSRNFHIGPIKIIFLLSVEFSVTGVCLSKTCFAFSIGRCSMKFPSFLSWSQLCSG